MKKGFIAYAECEEYPCERYSRRGWGTAQLGVKHRIDKKWGSSVNVALSGLILIANVFPGILLLEGERDTLR